MTLEEILDAIAAALATVAEADQVVAWLNLEPAGATLDVYPGDPFTDEEIGGGFQTRAGAYIFTIRARVPSADFDAARTLMLAWMDSGEEGSVEDALYSSSDLEAAAESFRVEGPSGLRRYQDVQGGPVRLGCEWRLTLIPIGAT